eukprot:m.122381 g.122381  ORF g.122381 m.122381 type:complete len:423 (-) comp9626_c0_seq2:650-1918(-)
MGIGRKSIPKGHELRLGNGRGFIVCRLALAKKRVNLVNKNDAGLQLFRNGEQSVNQLLALAVPLVHKGRRLKIDKGATALLGKSLSSHGLATTRRAKQQNTLGRAAEARIEEVWPRKREHNVLLEGGNGFLEAANTLPANGEVGGVDHVARNHVLVLAELDTLASKTVHQSLSRNSAFGLAAALGVGALEKPLEAEKEDNLNCPHKHQLAQQVRLFAGRQHCCRPVACGLCTSSPAAAPAASRGAPMPFLRLHWAVATSACVIGLILVPVLWTQLCFHMAYLGLALLLPLAVFLQIDRQRARTQSPMHHVLQRARRRLLASMAVFFALFAAHCLSVVCAITCPSCAAHPATFATRNRACRGRSCASATTAPTASVTVQSSASLAWAFSPPVQMCSASLAVDCSHEGLQATINISRSSQPQTL